MSFSKREYMLLMNGLAMTLDVLHVDTKGEIPSCQELDAYLDSQGFAQGAYADQPFISFQELNDLFTKLWLMVQGQYNELALLPPTQLQ